MPANKMTRIIAAAAAAGAIVVGGAMLANAATGATPSTTSSTSSQTQDTGQNGGGPSGASDTPVTGDELSKVTAAVKAKDSAVTVDRVQKDPDGSYDVFGTKSGGKVMFEVSGDLKTITQNTQACGDGRGPNGTAPNGTAPSGTMQG